ncbi:hypothetical protein L6R50_07535 [Myxococcota bacterium]|nr:hypothetical protein [Myxococcota bacterium]
MTCIDCGYTYGIEKPGCGSCDSRRSCGGASCPRCGYRSVPETALSRLLARVLKGHEPRRAPRLPVVDA